MARATSLASRAAMVATILTAVWVFWHMPNNNLARWYAGVGIGGTYLLVRLIVKRIAMEALP